MSRGSFDVGGVITISYCLSRGLNSSLFLFALLGHCPGIVFGIGTSYDCKCLARSFGGTGLIVDNDGSSSNDLLLGVGHCYSGVYRCLARLRGTSTLMAVNNSLCVRGRGEALETIITRGHHFFESGEGTQGTTGCCILNTGFNPFCSGECLSFCGGFFSGCYRSMYFESECSTDLFSSISGIQCTPSVLFGMRLPGIIHQGGLFVSIISLGRMGGFGGLSGGELTCSRLVVGCVEGCSRLKCSVILYSFSHPRNSRCTIHELVRYTGSREVTMQALCC